MRPRRAARSLRTLPSLRRLPSLRVRRSLRHRRWTLVGAALFVVLTSLLGQASAAGARDTSAAKASAPLQEGKPGTFSFTNLRARFCGTSTSADVVGSLTTPVGIPLTIAKHTGLCKGARESKDWIYCNGTSLLSMADPREGFGGNPVNADGSIDKGDLALNAITPTTLRFWIDQMNGTWYYMPKQQLEQQGLGWYYEEARREAIDRGNCALLEHLPDPSCEVINKMPKQERLKHVRGGILPDECVGTYPTANYNISYDGGGALSFDRKIWGWATGLLFNVNKGAVQIATWSIGQAFGFNLRDYTQLATNISDRYQDEIVGPVGLDDFAWLMLIGYAAIAALRGKFGVAGGEFFMAVLMIGMAQVLLANQPFYMNSASRMINLTSSALFRVANGDEGFDVNEDPSKGDTTDPLWNEALIPLKKNIHVQFVERPWEYLNYKELIENLDGECKVRAERLAAVGATGDDGWSWRYLSGAADENSESGRQCRRLVSYNRVPTATRFWGAALTMIIGGTVALTLTLLSITVLISKFMIAILFALAPFAAALAAMPGTTRRVSFLWATSVLQCMAAVIGSGGLLSIGLVAVDFVLTKTSTDPNTGLFERWSIVLVVVCTVFAGRRVVLSGTRNMAGRMADAMVRVSPAGAGWQGGGGGVDLLAADRGLATAGRSARTTAVHAGYIGGAGFVMAGRSIHARSTERRNAKRMLRNLEIMKQRDEEPKQVVKWRKDGSIEDSYVEQTIRTPRATPAAGENYKHMKMRGKRDFDKDQRRNAREVADRTGWSFDERTGLPGKTPHRSQLTRAQRRRMPKYQRRHGGGGRRWRRGGGGGRHRRR